MCAANAVSLQLHALAYKPGHFMRTLVMPKTAEPCSLARLREKLIKIGAMIASHARSIKFRDSRGRGVAADVRRHPVADRPAACTARSCMTAGLRCERTMREVRPIAGKAARFHASRGRLAGSIACDLHEVRFVVVEDAQRRDAASKSLGIGGMSVYNFRPLIAERR